MMALQKHSSDLWPVDDVSYLFLRAVVGCVVLTPAPT